jgi:hypothetical protein
MSMGHGARGKVKSKKRVRFGPLIAQQSQGNEIAFTISRGSAGDEHGTWSKEQGAWGKLNVELPLALASGG